MSAEVLRSAAAAMRQRAEAVNTKGRWTAGGLYEQAEHCRCFGCYKDEPWAFEIYEMDGPDSGDCIHPMHIEQGDAQHIASWHPAVALAVADWLEDLANRITLSRQLCHVDDEANALAVARAYLGVSA